MNKNDELVEEVRLIWCEDCSDGPARCEYSPDLDDDICEGGIETIKFCNERARKIIARVVEGPLPGEVGQFFKRRGWEKGIHNWVADMTAAGATRFIALRLTGTGEEKADGKHGG